MARLVLVSLAMLLGACGGGGGFCDTRIGSCTQSYSGMIVSCTDYTGLDKKAHDGYQQNCVASYYKVFSQTTVASWSESGCATGGRIYGCKLVSGSCSPPAAEVIRFYSPAYTQQEGKDDLSCIGHTAEP